MFSLKSKRKDPALHTQPTTSKQESAWTVIRFKPSLWETYFKARLFR